MRQRVRVELATSRLELRPGESATVAAELRNTTDVVQHLRVDVLGLPAGAVARAEPELVKLLPGGTANTCVTVQLAAHPPATAGTHMLGVRAQSTHAGGASRCEELPLSVPAAPALQLRVEPALVSGRRRADLSARITNEGNVRLPVVLSGQDAEHKLSLSLHPATLELAPGTSDVSRVRVRAPGTWSRREVSRAITVRASVGRLAAEAHATFVQRPHWSRTALLTARSTARALVVLVLLGVAVALVVGAYLVVPRLLDVLEGATSSPPAVVGEDAAPSGPSPGPVRSGLQAREATTPLPS